MVGKFAGEKHWNWKGGAALHNRYGFLTRREYDSLFSLQKGVCAICGKRETRKTYGKVCKLSADHNHKTGKARGLLCGGCNIGLGGFKDNPEYLQNAIKYLKEYE